VLKQRKNKDTCSKNCQRGPVGGLSPPDKEDGSLGGEVMKPTCIKEKQKLPKLGGREKRV